MSFYQAGTVRYYAFNSLEGDGLRHAVFTRQGGVSPAPWASLNLGGTVGDDVERVAENRLRALRCFDTTPDTLYDVWQVHSADVVRVEAPRPAHVPHERADAIVTDRPGITLLMRFADCVPILLYDPARRVIGMAHAGWQGTVKGVAGAVIESMRLGYGCQPADILAAIGPSIGPDHYEVGPDVAVQVKRVFGQDAMALLSGDSGAVKFDLWAANRLQLAQAGVKHIETAGICTACHLEDWFSHRAEKGKTGRFGVAMRLSDQGRRFGT